MKQLALLAFTLFSLCLNAQTLYMKSGVFTPQENVASIKDFSNWTPFQFGNKTYCLLQFSGTTSPEQRQAISKVTGIIFYDYFPRWAFLAAVPKNIDISILSNYNVRSILPYEGKYKISPKLNQRPLPEWMDKGYGQFEILAEMQHDISQSAILNLLQEHGFELVKWKNQFTAILKIDESQIQSIAEFPWIKYLEYTSAPAVAENLMERTNHRVNTIDASYASGFHYDGSGVSVAVGDDGLIGPHIDFAGRVFDHTSNNNGTHADHVCGIVGGGGNFDPITSGNARGSNIHVYSDYDNLLDAPIDYSTDGVRITSNSLGQGCNLGYNADAKDADILINSKPSLMSVHSAGNSGNTSCGSVPQFYTITGGYKAGKNVMAVGNVNNADVLNPSSSCGPSEDGRIKPEIVAVGTNVYSTQPDNTYDTFTGTSMACPAVSGTLADMWQAYRETHAGADPSSALIKGIVMNTADDLGNEGPDFKFGFGRINARRALNCLNNNQFFVDSVTTGNGKDFYLNVPPNTRKLKVMLYWNDYEGNPASTISLVNDLGLTVQEPSGNVIDPWVLDNTPTVAALNAPATRGVDYINNVEQVTLDSVIPGPMVISVVGVDVPQGPQKYVLTYEFINDVITLTYPQGGESFANGRKERIRWDAFGNAGGNFTLEYSADAGGTWNNISTTIPDDDRFYDWTPPSTLNTGQMKMRISRGSVSDETDTLFTVFDVPKNLMVDTACADIFHLTWDALPFADEYIIYSMGPKYMTQIGTSATNGFTIAAGVNMTDTFYYAVAGVNTTNGAMGLRTLAYVKLPGNVNCIDDAYNVATILPFDYAYTCAITGLIPIKVKIKNVGFRPLANLQVFYQVNLSPVVSETVPTVIPIGDSLIYTFTTLAPMSVPNTYNVKTWTSLWTDVVLLNDTSETNATVAVATTLSAPSVQDFEGPLFPPTGWRVIDNDANVKWQKTLCLVDPTGFNSHSAYMDFFNYTNLNQMDDLQTAQFDLTGVVADTVLMTFDVSHAYGNAGLDSLQILISEDCAANFTPTTYYKGGVPLATAGMMSSIFSPTLTTQWRNDRLNLTSYIGKKIFLRFRANNKKGNNLFIDNINIMLKTAWPLTNSTLSDNDQVMVYPNPSDGNYTIEFNSSISREMRYSIYNIAGQKLRENKLSLSSGNTKVALNISSMSTGMYILELRDGTNIKKIKLNKY